MKRWNCLIALVIAACALNISAAHAKKPDNPGGGSDDANEPYQIIELTTLGGSVWNINELADGSVEAVGYVGNAAHYWKVTQSGDVAVSRQLKSDIPGGVIADEVRALAINDVGVMVGYAGSGSISFPSDPEFPSLECLPLFWKDSTSDAVILPVPDGCQGVAKSINVDGVVLGYIWNDTHSWVIAWKIDLTFPDPEFVNYFPFLEQEYADIPFVRSCAISDSGFGAASVDVAQSYRFELQFDGQDLRVVAGTMEPLWYDWSDAYDINDIGTVAGSHTLPLENGRNWQAFVMDTAGNLVTLETPPAERIRGQVYEYGPERAYSINDFGESVGSMTRYRASDRMWYGDFPAIWDATGALTAPPAGWELCLSINDAGWIGGQTSSRTPGVLIPVLAP